MGTKGPVNNHNINNMQSKSAFSPVQPNNNNFNTPSSSSSSASNPNPVLPTFQEWASNWPLAMRTIENYNIRNHVAPIPAFGTLLLPPPLFLNHRLEQHNAHLLAALAQRQYCFDPYTSVPTSQSHHQQYSNASQQPSTSYYGNGSGSNYSFNYQNLPYPPSYDSQHQQNPSSSYSSTLTTQNVNNNNNNNDNYYNTNTRNGQPVGGSSYLSDGDSSITDGTFIDVDSLSSDDEDSFNPIILKVVGSPMPQNKESNGCARSTPHSSSKQDREDLLRILAGVDAEQEEEEKRKVATEVLCSKFAYQKVSPPVQNIDIQRHSCILTEENARVAVSTRNHTAIEKQGQDQPLDKVAMTSEKENDGEKERDDQEMTMVDEGNQRTNSKDASCSSTGQMNEKSSETSMNLDNTSNNHENDHSKSIQELLATKDHSFKEKLRATLKNTFEEHWKNIVTTSKVSSNAETSSSKLVADNESTPLVIVEENSPAEKQPDKNSSNREEPMDVDEQSLMDHADDKHTNIMQNGKKIDKRCNQDDPRGESSSNPNQPPILLLLKKQGNSFVSKVSPQVNGKHRLPATVKKPTYSRPINTFADSKQFLMKNSRFSSV